jgi:hypothetical protein
VPAPSQRPASVCVEPVQVCMPQARPGAYSRQAPAPLHDPSVPQLFEPESAHWFNGSVLAGTAVQTPRLPASAHDVQIPVQAPAQQTPCWHEPEAHSVPAAQSVPLTFLPQIVPLQTLPPEQSALVVQAVRHVPAVPQEYGSQPCCEPRTHMPAPSQRPGSVAVTPVQAGGMHCVPDANRRQAARPLHIPSLPQVEAPWSAHWPSGSLPSGTLVQVPTLPGTLHERQVPVQAAPQQTPCSQKPELHSGPPPHAAPIGFLPQLLLMQLLGATQSASVVQMVRQRPSVAQLNGAHDWPGVEAQTPAPSQRKADVSVDPVQPISWQIVPAGYLSHAPVPSHMPVEPQVDAAATGHSSRGSVPTCALTQVPTVPWPAQVTHTPVQAAPQHTPSAQKPLAHSPAIAHEDPSGLPGASIAASARSTGASPGATSAPSYGPPSPQAVSRGASAASAAVRCSPPPPQPALDTTAPNVSMASATSATGTRRRIRA